MYREDTIAAVATPPGEGGVGIVRISGVDAEAIAAQIFARNKKHKLRSHVLHHGTIRDPQNGRTLDEVLLSVMRKPHSYTGEDVVEIYCHGGAFIVRGVLGLVLRHGARQAEPGEFSKRAFLNGRLDLAQAEAVLDVIRARTEKSAAMALDQAGGALSQWVGELRESLLDVLVQVEAAIDFPEEEIELLRRSELINKITALGKKIKDISMTYDWGRLFREGAKVCICGRPNVGKSSLLNALLGSERVIVTPIAGTTRDVIEEAITLDGLPALLWDTAGIRESEDQLERLGVDLSRRHIAMADAVVVVLDGSQPLSIDDKRVLNYVAGKKILTVVNKADLPQRLAVQELEPFIAPTSVTAVSAKTCEGVAELKQSLRSLLLDTALDTPIVITNLRHRTALEKSCLSLTRAATSLGEGYASEFVALDLNESRAALEEITGVIHNEDILERIFADFCIGK
jgi:tRNA modification GTPase